MITSKQEYRYYLAADLAAHGLTQWRWWDRYRHITLFYQRLLRTLEYYRNCRRDPVGRLYAGLVHYRLWRLGLTLGFTLPVNVFGPGLSLAHYGSIIVNADTRVGKNCRIHSCVNIGVGGGKCPVIGDNVYIGPGAKLFGGITIGDNVAIGANAVVHRDVPPNVTVGGIPARIIAERGSQALIIDGCAVAERAA